MTKSDTRLFCFAHAGGGASSFRVWRNLLPESVELVAIQLPGRENRYGEKPFTELESVVEAILRELESFIDLPFSFFGHSLGALIAFEVARGLRRNNMPLPCHLFLSGRGAPHIESVRKDRHELSDDELIAEVLRIDRDSCALLANPGLVDVVLPILRADFALHDTYCYKDAPPFDIPVSVYCGKDDDACVVDNVESWRCHTNKTFSLNFYEGDHFYLRSQKDNLIADIRKLISGKGY